MDDHICTLTERGQVSLPTALRRQMHLKAGQRLRWEAVSGPELRIRVEAEQPDPLAALGFGPRMRKQAARSTSDWMEELHAGECL